MHVPSLPAPVSEYEVRVLILGKGLRRLARQFKAMPLVQRHYHPFLVKGVEFVGRQPRLHRVATIGCRLVPGLQAYLRRFVTETKPDGETPSLEMQLRLVPGSSISAHGLVTLEDLALIARTL